MRTGILFSIATLVFSFSSIAQTLDWAKHLGITNVPEVSFSIAVNSSGEIYTCGSFANTLDFNPGSGVYNLTSEGNEDVFIQKWSSNGNLIWARSVGGTEQDWGESLCLDHEGNVLITGRFRQTADFNPGSGEEYLYGTMYILKLSSSGSFLWAKAFGDPDNYYTSSRALCTDSVGNVYTTGQFGGTVDFDPGPDVYNLTSHGGTDIFALKLNSNGDFVWAKGMGSEESFEQGRDIFVSPANQVYLTGTFRGIADFDPGPDVFNLTPISADIFVQKLDIDGSLIWAKGMGGTYGSSGAALTLDQAGNVLITGQFRDSVDFDPGPGEFFLAPTGNADSFVEKLDNNGNFIWVINIGGIGWEQGYSILSDSLNNVYSLGIFQVTVDFDPGAGEHILNSANAASDIFIAKYNQCISNSIDVQNACDEFTWIDGITYTESSNNASITLSNAQGCDSIVSLDLTIEYSDFLVESISACEEYTWIDGITYTESNNDAFVVFTNSVGCDSIVALDLTISTIDTSIMIDGTVITANASDLNYQWLDCNNNLEIIPGATAQSFSPLENGQYAVELSDGICIDTSSCVDITIVSINNIAKRGRFHLYPNPTSTYLNIEIDFSAASHLTIYDLNGRKVSSIFIEQSKFQIEIAHFQAGLYFVELISSSGNRYIEKIVINPD